MSAGRSSSSGRDGPFPSLPHLPSRRSDPAAGSEPPSGTSAPRPRIQNACAPTSRHPVPPSRYVLDHRRERGGRGRRAARPDRPPALGDDVRPVRCGSSTARTRARRPAGLTTTRPRTTPGPTRWSSGSAPAPRRHRAAVRPVPTSCRAARPSSTGSGSGGKRRAPSSPTPLRRPTRTGSVRLRSRRRPRRTRPCPRSGRRPIRPW